MWVNPSATASATAHAHASLVLVVRARIGNRHDAKRQARGSGLGLEHVPTHGVHGDALHGLVDCREQARDGAGVLLPQHVEGPCAVLAGAPGQQDLHLNASGCRRGQSPRPRRRGGGPQSPGRRRASGVNAVAADGRHRDQRRPRAPRLGRVGRLRPRGAAPRRRPAAGSSSVSCDGCTDSSRTSAKTLAAAGQLQQIVQEADAAAGVEPAQRARLARDDQQRARPGAPPATRRRMPSSLRAQGGHHRGGTGGVPGRARRPR